jgi:hypothetical protein
MTERGFISTYLIILRLSRGENKVIWFEKPHYIKIILAYMNAILIDIFQLQSYRQSCLAIAVFERLKLFNQMNLNTILTI